MPDILSAPWEYEVPPIRITDDVWYVGNRDVGSHIIDTGDGFILIDTAYPQTFSLLLKSVRACGFDPADIKYILHTHAHYDHIGATRMLTEAYGCRTFLGAGDAFILSERPELTWHSELGQPFNEGFLPDVLLYDGDEVSLGHVRIGCIASPGHTPGNMTYVWQTRCGGIAHTCVLSGGWWPNTAESGYLKKYSLSGWRENYSYTFDRLSSLDADIMLGAHPSFNSTFEKAVLSGKGTWPFVVPGEWRAALEAGKKQFGELCAGDPL